MIKNKSEWDMEWRIDLIILPTQIFNGKKVLIKFDKPNHPSLNHDTNACIKGMETFTRWISSLNNSLVPLSEKDHLFEI